jgi:hypothetical protein
VASSISGNTANAQTPDSQRAEQEDAAPAVAVRQRAAGEQDGDHHQAAGHHREQQQVAVQAHRRRAIGHRIGDGDVEAGVVGDERAAGQQDLAPVAARGLRERRGRVRAGSPAPRGAGSETPKWTARPMTISRTLSTKPMRQPQAMKASSVLRALTPRNTSVGQHHAQRHADLDEAAVEAAAMGRRALDRQQRRAAPLSADRQALDEAQRHQQQRRPDADAGVAGQQADQRGRQAHHEHRHDQNALAPVDVAIMTEQHAAERGGR